MIIEIISSVLVVCGSLFLLIASIGILKLPDFYIRNSAITKAITFGLSLMLIGISLYYYTIAVSLKIAGIIFFIFLTSPVSGHVISRAAWKNKVPFWKETDINDFLPFLKKHNVGQETRFTKEKE
jgi:multicomponent Na+:H+ antiporter subunit G